MRNIKEVKSELAALRVAYGARVQVLEAEIESIRSARGYVKKIPAFETYYEAGRSRMPVPGMGASLEAGSMCDGLGKDYF